MLYDPLALVVALLSLSLLPFIVMMVTSYVKLAVVLSLVRNALGVQQVPPNMVLNGMSIILSIFIMAPVLEAVIARVPQDAIGLGSAREISLSSLSGLAQAADTAVEPLRDFLLKHAKPKSRVFFSQAAYRLWPKGKSPAEIERSLFVLIPAFMVSELTSAFQIGFLLYLPFVVVDLVVSNILLAMGMMMVSPMTISLPFKLLLFVLLDGWSKVIEGLILSYR
ncbi:MAG: type III secretion system export apparatus subunit SctR [Planctomycetaceae bacterium]|nr:type III secretion system export apparatus subunit SctR [Planctomycetaceae bacterium]